MSRGTPSDVLNGETTFISIHHAADDGEAAALVEAMDSDGLPIRCSLSITNYRIMIHPVINNNNNNNNNNNSSSNSNSNNECFDYSLPIMSIDSWAVPRGTMTLAQRSVFQRSRGNTFLETEKTSSKRNIKESPLPPLTESNFQSTVHLLKISSKHLWDVSVFLQGERAASAISDLRQHCRVTHIKNMPAFKLYQHRYSTHREDADDIDTNNNNNNNNNMEDVDLSGVVEFGWTLYDPDREMQRQLCISPENKIPNPGDVELAGPRRDLRPWFRLTNISGPPNSYGKSPTYPFQVIIPSAASETLLEEAMTARARARFPAIVFVHLGTGAVLARSSQPLARANTLRQDGELCSMLTNSGYHAHNAAPRGGNATLATTSTITSNINGINKNNNNNNNNNNNKRMIPPPSLFETEPSESMQRVSEVITQQDAPPRRQRTLLVIDCRPYTVAYATRSTGGGFEGGATHDFCDVKFYGIDNIHAVAKSFSKLKALIQQYNGKQPKEDFFKQLHDTSWLYHIQRVLICSNEIAEALDRGESCLVHCTDGWDRTPQCTATAMLLLDPFYRTIIGFSVLVEKEFCSFGHKFAERCGHQVRGETNYAAYFNNSGVDMESTITISSSGSQTKLEPSPVFVQWMDIVFQIVRQFPRYFEFTPRLLEYLSEEVYSCLHGTFLANGEKERMFEGVRLETTSIWTNIARAAIRERSGEVPLYFVNETYDSITAWEYISKKKGSGIQRITPNCNSKRLVFWESFYLRHDMDNYSIGFNDLLQQENKVQVNFHKEWDLYFKQFIKDSCVARRKEIVYMREQLQNLDLPSPPPTSIIATVVKGDSKCCYQCHKKFGVFSTREQCRGCRSIICTSCTIYIDKGLKMCRECYKLHEWNSP